MAQFNDVTRKLVIVVNGGVTSTGSRKTKTRTFAGLSETASAENVLAAGQALASLMDEEVLNMYVNDKNEVVQG